MKIFSCILFSTVASYGYGAEALNTLWDTGSYILSSAREQVFKLTQLNPFITHPRTEAVAEGKPAKAPHKTILEILHQSDLERIYRVKRNIQVDPDVLKNMADAHQTDALDQMLEHDLSHHMYSKELVYLPGVPHLLSPQIISDMNRRGVVVIYKEKPYTITNYTTPEDYTTQLFNKLVKAIKRESRTAVHDLELLYETVHRILYMATQTFDRDSLDFIQVHFKKEYQIEVGDAFIGNVDTSTRFEILQDKINHISSSLYKVFDPEGLLYGFVKVDRSTSFFYNIDRIPDEIFTVKFIPSIEEVEPAPEDPENEWVEL